MGYVEFSIKLKLVFVLKILKLEDTELKLNNLIIIGGCTDNKFMARTIMPNGRFTDEELGLLKNAFSESFPVLRLLRVIFLQMPMSEQDEIEWRRIFKGNKELCKLMKKIFLPELDADMPLMQQIDLYLTLNIADKEPEHACLLIDAREVVVQYLYQQLEILEEGGDADLHLSELLSTDNKTGIERFRDFLARNAIITHVEQQLNQIYMLAGKKTETPEETIKRLSQDSSK